MNNYTT